MMLFELKGANGIVYFYDFYLVISRKTLSGFIDHGEQPNRRIYYKDLSTAEYKEAGSKPGHIKFVRSFKRGPSVGVSKDLDAVTFINQENGEKAFKITLDRIEVSKVKR